MFAEIILNKTSKELNKVFDYIIPSWMECELKLGDRVLVPFGRGTKLVDGIVTNIKDVSQFANREIAEIKSSYLTKENVEFAKLMARRYFCNDFDCIKLMLPPGTISKEVDNWIKDKFENFVYLIKSEDEIKADILNKKIKSEKHKEILKCLLDKQDKILMTDLERELDVSRGVIKTVEKNGYIEIRSEVVKRNPFGDKDIERDTEFVLNDEQQYAFFRVNDCIEKALFQELLLYGVTGSRQDRGVFATYKVCYRKGKDCDYVGS